MWVCVHEGLVQKIGRSVEKCFIFKVIWSCHTFGAIAEGSSEDCGHAEALTRAEIVGNLQLRNLLLSIYFEFTTPLELWLLAVCSSRLSQQGLLTRVSSDQRMLALLALCMHPQLRCPRLHTSRLKRHACAAAPP